MEQSKIVYSVLQCNVESIAEPEEYSLFQSSLLKAKILGPFELIFLDPPYREGLYDSSLQHIVNQKWLSQNGIIAVELPLDTELTLPPGFEVVLDRVYGKSKLCLLTTISVTN